MLGDIVFHHPKDVQDGKVEVGPDDILTNLPYVAGCALCFDHHASEALRNQGQPTPNYVLMPEAKSAARVVYDYYGGRERFERISDDMMTAVDKADSAGFSRQDVLEPKGWELLLFLMDARTGLGRFRDFRVSNYQLMMMLIDCCRDWPSTTSSRCPTCTSGSSSISSSSRPSTPSSSAWPRCMTTSWCWICAAKKSFTPNRFMILRGGI